MLLSDRRQSLEISREISMGMVYSAQDSELSGKPLLPGLSQPLFYDERHRRKRQALPFFLIMSAREALIIYKTPHMKSS